MTDYSDYSDDEQINENELSPTERQQLKAEKALEKVVKAIYGYEGTYPQQIYNQVHECIRLIGLRIAPHKPKKGKFHILFYMCYKSDSGMPQTPNTAYTILTTIFRALYDVDEKYITFDETFERKNGYVNTDYFFVGTPYKFPTSKQQQQNAKNNFHSWFDNAPLNKILERFMDLMNGRTADKSTINSKAQSGGAEPREVERKADDSVLTQSIKALDDIDSVLPQKRKDEIDAKLKQIKYDIKALKQIKHDEDIDESTREAAKSTIKTLKEQKKTIKHGKRRNPQHESATNMPKPTETHENETSTEKASKRLTEQQRKRLLAEAWKRITEQFKASKNEKERKQTEQKDILPTKQKMTKKRALQVYKDLILDIGHFDDFDKWRGYQTELNAVNDELQANGYAIPPELVSIFERLYIDNLEDQLMGGVITELKARDILMKDLLMLSTKYASSAANEILSRITGYIEPIEYSIEPVKLADRVKSDVGLIPRVEEALDDIKSSSERRVRLYDPNRHGKRRNAPSITPQTKRISSITPKIDVSVPGKIDANFNPKNMTATIRPVFKAKLTF